MRVVKILWPDGSWSGDIELVPENDEDQKTLDQLAEEGELDESDYLRSIRDQPGPEAGGKA